MSFLRWTGGIEGEGEGEGKEKEKEKEKEREKEKEVEGILNRELKLIAYDGLRGVR